MLADSPLWVSAIGWILFTLYWEAVSKNAAPATRSESRRSRKVHLFLANIALIAMFLPIPGLVQRYLPALPRVIAAGLAIQTAGLMLAVWARRHLGRNWSGEITIKVDHRLVRTGPYSKVRHPIYTSLLAMYAGTAVVSGEMHALLGLALAVFAYARKVRLEETNLTEAFGGDYQAYQGETWALLPGVF
jgi:protein-S-isoprenylcysteine O-methyltransferase Ste14